MNIDELPRKWGTNESYKYYRGGHRKPRRRVDNRFGTSELALNDEKEASRQRISDEGWTK